jgi:hypothetical protein
MNATRATPCATVSFLIVLCLIAWPGATRGELPGRWVSLGPTKILGGNTAVSSGDVTGRARRWTSKVLGDAEMVEIDATDANAAGCRSDLWASR